MMQWSQNFSLRKIYIVLLVFLCAASSAGAKDSVVAVNVNQSLSVTAYQVTQASVANPEIADIVIISDRELVVIGKKAGGTTLRVWTADGSRYTYEVRVGNIDAAGSETIRQLIGYPEVQVNVLGGTVLLEGMVSDQGEKQRAEKIAEAYSGKVVNLLEVTDPKQVRLEVQILEIDSSKTGDLGIQYGNTTAGDQENTFTMGAPGVFMVGQSVPNNQTGHMWKDFGSYADISATVSALVKNGNAQILSSPSVITMSGEKANILIGGELPIPVAYDDNKVSVEWKEYGIKLDIEPLVDSKGRIHSSVKAEVSNIDAASSYTVNLGGGFVIPALRTRRAESVVDMPSGATMAIGGLISSEESEQISKFPILGDLPIIGEFFRHTSTSKERKEIVILVTPTLTWADEDVDMSGGMRSLRERADAEPLDAEEAERLKAAKEDKMKADAADKEKAADAPRQEAKKK